MKSVTFLFLSLLIATSLFAQQQTQPTDSGSLNEDEAQSKREAKLQSVKPYKPNKIVDVLSTFENDGIDPFVSIQVKDFRMGLGSISPLSGLTPAIRYERPRLGNTDLTLWVTGAYSIYKYQWYQLLFGKFNFPIPSKQRSYLEAPFDFDYRSQRPHDRLLYFDAAYRSYPQEIFYGLGSDAPEFRTAYELDEADIGVKGGYQISRSTGILGGVSYLRPDINGPGRNVNPPSQNYFDELTAPGITDQPDFIAYHATFVGGYLGDPYRPSGIASFEFSRFSDRADGRFSFDKFVFDGRGYLTLWCRQRVIAVRSFIVHERPDDGAEVPFYYMETLGGRDTLRGFQNYRFRDRNQMYFSGEYRWEGNPAVELAVFYDTGKVFHDTSDFDFNNLKHSTGFGLRFKNLRRTVLRFDVGFGSEGIFGHFAIGPSF